MVGVRCEVVMCHRHRLQQGMGKGLPRSRDKGGQREVFTMQYSRTTQLLGTETCQEPLVRKKQVPVP